MNNYTKQLQSELDNCGKTPLFEIEVIDVKTGKKEYIGCDIFFQGNLMVCHRDGISTTEQNSKFIATTKVAVDNCLSLDEHLETLYELVTDDIREGNLFSLKVGD